MTGEGTNKGPAMPGGPAPGPPMPLAHASVGQELQFAGVRGGRGLRHRLAEKGLTPGVRFRVMAKGRPGPFIILLMDMRLMLGHGMVLRILVHPV